MPNSESLDVEWIDDDGGSALLSLTYRDVIVIEAALEECEARADLSPEAASLLARMYELRGEMQRCMT